MREDIAMAETVMLVKHMWSCIVGGPCGNKIRKSNEIKAEMMCVTSRQGQKMPLCHSLLSFSVFCDWGGTLLQIGQLQHGVNCHLGSLRTMWSTALGQPGMNTPHKREINLFCVHWNFRVTVLLQDTLPYPR